MAKRIDVKNVDIYYGKFQAVRGIDLTIAPRSVTAVDHGPGPKRAVSAPAAAFCRAAMAGTSSGVASRNFRITCDLASDRGQAG